MPISFSRRTKLFAQDMIEWGDVEKIRLLDVGSGGTLKEPWSLIPSNHLMKLDIDPEAGQQTGITSLPLCISNRSTEGIFNVAYDARSSSLHDVNDDFVERFNRPEIRASKKINVRLMTLDNMFDEMRHIDAMDVNVEGHDFQVLEGASKLLSREFIKIIKVEFELAKVWEGQGKLGDITDLLEQAGFELINIEIEYARPHNAADLHHRGEPLWGKAYFAPKYSIVHDKLNNTRSKAEFAKLVTLLVLFDAPGRAKDAVDSCTSWLNARDSEFISNSISHVYRHAGVTRRFAKLSQPIFNQLKNRALAGLWRS